MDESVVPDDLMVFILGCLLLNTLEDYEVNLSHNAAFNKKICVTE